MSTTGTKDAAEAILRELPSVVGASVTEDSRGHPREVHLLVTPGPDAGSFARDIRELLEERLGIPIDQRVISIAQVSAADVQDRKSARIAAIRAQRGRRPGRRPEDPAADPAAAARPEPVTNDAGNPEHEAAEPTTAPERTENGTREDVSPDARLAFAGIESTTEGSRAVVRVRLRRGDREFEGQARAAAAGAGPVRAAALATVTAINAACGGALRLELDSAAPVHALEREYSFVVVLAYSARFGRRPLSLVGAEPAGDNIRMATALAALKACNRVLATALAAAARGASA